MDKFISPFIQSQFPAFYNDQGPNFIAFMQAYYEWAEQTDLTDPGSGIIGKARSIPDYLDIDSTAAQFVTHFTNTYVASIPVDIAADRQLLVKHILDLYRSKGTPRSYELLFRLLFNEDIDLYIPGQFVFKTSDNDWIVPKYIECTDNPYLNQLIGQPIYNSSLSAEAVVENVQQKVVNQRTINVLYLSAVNGTFKYGEQILSKQVPAITIANAPRVLGSLTAVAINNGGLGFNIGDSLSVQGSGVGAIARVVSTVDQNGKVTFTLVNGGSGFSSNPNIVVATTYNFNFTGLSGVFSAGDTLLDTTSNANGTITRANSSFIELINFTGTPQYKFSIGDTITGSNGASATLTKVLGGAGAGASFTVGGLINQELYQINPDTISGYTSTIIDPPASGIGFNVYVSGETGVFTVGNTATSSANMVMLEGSAATANLVANGESLSNTSLGIANLYVYDSEGSNGSMLIFVTGNDANLINASLAPGVTLVSNITSSQVLLTGVNPKTTVTANATIFSQNTSMLGVQFSSGIPHGYFIHGSTVTDTQTGHTAIVNNVIRTTDWGSFSGNPSGNNLDTKLYIALQFLTKQVGTIAFLGNINPGGGYTTNPYVDVNELTISALGQSDGLGGIKGHNAVITNSVLNAKGIATAVKIVDSGFGYNPDETVYLQPANSSVVVTGTSIVQDHGKGQGSWTSDKSFTSDTQKLLDSNYYQDFSYEIVASRMISTYESLVRNLVHPSGIALFGKYRFKDSQTSSASVAVQMSLTQS